MTQPIPTPIPVLFDWLFADAGLTALTRIGSEYLVDGDGAPVVPFLLVRIATGVDTTSDLPELVVTAQCDAYGPDKVTAQTVASRLVWNVVNRPTYVSPHGYLRGVTLTGYQDLSDFEADSRYRFSLDIAASIHRPD